MTRRDSIRIELTTDQQQQIKDALGSEIASLELGMLELEQRIAPSSSSTSISQASEALKTVAQK